MLLDFCCIRELQYEGTQESEGNLHQLLKVWAFDDSNNEVLRTIGTSLGSATGDCGTSHSVSVFHLYTGQLKFDLAERDIVDDIICTLQYNNINRAAHSISGYNIFISIFTAKKKSTQCLQDNNIHKQTNNYIKPLF